MNSKKMKRCLIIIVSVVAIFGIYNLIWLNITHAKYSGYIEGMTELEKNVSYCVAKDGYAFNVKFPSYLSFKGNLGVSGPDQTALVIWPNCFNDSKKYGLRFTTEAGENYSIYVDSDMNALDSQYEELTRQNKALLLELKERTSSLWQVF